MIKATAEQLKAGTEALRRDFRCYLSDAEVACLLEAALNVAPAGEIGGDDPTQAMLDAGLDWRPPGDAGGPGMTIGGTRAWQEEILARVYRAMRAAASPSTVPVAREAWQATHRHKKRGTDHRLLFEARGQFTDLIYDDRQFVVYEDADGGKWVRPRNEFYDGRFEQIKSALAATDKAP